MTWQIKLFLVLFIFLAGAVAGGKVVQNHYKAKEADRLKAVAEAMTAMVNRANELSAKDVQETRKAEQTRQATRLRQQEKEHELELAAAFNHKPDCNISADEHRLLNDLIDNANGKKDAASGVRDSLRLATSLEWSEGHGRSHVGVQGDTELRRVSQQARGVRQVDGELWH